MIKLAIFDLDGTLIQTELYSYPAYKKAFEEYKITDITVETAMSMIGQRPEDYVKSLLPNYTDSVRKEFLKYAFELEKKYMVEYAKPFDGVPESLDLLRQNGFKTAICSNAGLDYIHAALDNMKIRDKIDYIQGLEDNLDKRGTLALLLKKLNPSFAALAGDRIYDIEAARHNNISCIGCAYGYSKTEVQSADIVVETAFELYPAFDRLNSK